MRIWVAGAGGMLGRYVCEAVKTAGEHLIATTHHQCPIDDLGRVMGVVEEARPDAIINCAGRTPGSGPDIEMVAANTVGPHNLAYAKVPMVHMSTDCVFSGDKDEYLPIAGGHPEMELGFRSDDNPDPMTLYGRTKLAGEVQADHVLNVRGSFIGPDGGFLRWLLTAEGTIDVWKNAWWNGTSVITMAAMLVSLAQTGRTPADRTGLVHVASEGAISKAEMARYFVDNLVLPLKLREVSEPRIWRVLASDYRLPDMEKSLAKCVDHVLAMRKEAKT